MTRNRIAVLHSLNRAIFTTGEVCHRYEEGFYHGMKLAEHFRPVHCLNLSCYVYNLEDDRPTDWLANSDALSCDE